MKKFLISILSFSLLVSLTFCKKKPYREYTIFTEGGNNFGRSALLEEELISKMIINYLLKEGISWQKPESWQEGKEYNFRLAAFLASDFLEITLVHFPGNAGGIRANIYRWLAQIQVEIDNKIVIEYMERLKVKKNKNELPYLLIDLKEISTKTELKENIIVGIFLFKDEILFVKIQGTPTQIKMEKSRFISLINSISLDNKK